MIANSGESEGIHADGPQWSAVWTRGDGCAELATLLDPEAGRVQGDLREACISARASVLVTRKLSSGLDLTNVAVPHDLEIGSVKAVAALVAGGANSLLAAQVAATLAEALGVPGRMLSAYADDASQPEALTVVERLFVEVPTLEYRAVLADPPAELVAQMREDELMVVGAPAGSWLQRQFFGQGARLVSHAPAGAVVVQAAPERVFRHMVEPHYVSRHLGAGDALRLHPVGLVAVVENRRLVGVATRTSLAMAGDGPSVETCMDEPISVDVADVVEEAWALSRQRGNVPIPVTDSQGLLVGMVEPPEL